MSPLAAFFRNQSKSHSVLIIMKTRTWGRLRSPVWSVSSSAAGNCRSLQCLAVYYIETFSFLNPDNETAGRDRLVMMWWWWSAGDSEDIIKWNSACQRFYFPTLGRFGIKVFFFHKRNCIILHFKRLLPNYSKVQNNYSQ